MSPHKVLQAICKNLCIYMYIYIYNVCIWFPDPIKQTTTPRCLSFWIALRPVWAMTGKSNETSVCKLWQNRRSGWNDSLNPTVWWPKFLDHLGMLKMWGPSWDMYRLHLVSLGFCPSTVWNVSICGHVNVTSPQAKLEAQLLASREASQFQKDGSWGTFST